MKFTRREFIHGGVTAFTIGFAAPAFLSDRAGPGSSRRSLVVLICPAATMRSRP
jgi:hypothetical protein